ncbi:polysaccharide pyruvyl transferase family protein [Butyrivibrio sp. AE2015]|uniref:polysaccharide pyruvyl transferase family protein n=1 Tax=Butyrivibrio sp. AE2015 TaxID=1280663 RepID=UPI0003B3311C|nr:polysaccharide pyruvyl transferase family protein [Butyrivibrio sp. AE2015]
MGIYSVLKKIDRELHIDKLRYYAKDKRYSFEQYFAIKKMCNEADFIMINTPNHGNLGDHAIAIAEQRFFYERFPSIRYREITGDYYRKNSSIIKKLMKTNIVLGISGGGYIGDVWMEEEELVRSVVSSFPDNKIIIFPQTVYYRDTEQGKQEWEITKKIFDNHRADVTFFLREKKSYDFIKNNLPTLKNVFLTPDMVLSLEKNYGFKRNGILLCFRDDREKYISIDIVKEIEKCAKEKNIEIKRSSTVLERNVDVSEREQAVEEKLKEFASAKLVVTDRLHGMLFAAITGTPCIAFDNETGKVGGVYEWIKDLNYVFFSDRNYSERMLFDYIQHLICKKNDVYKTDVYEWKKFFETIKNNILSV